MDLTHVRFSGTRPSPQERVAPAYRAPELLPATGLPAAVLAGAGLNPLHYRAAPLNRRVPACQRMLRAGSEADVLSALLIGFSGFFRDPDVFATLARAVLPSLGALNRPLRMLSVGCSSGQELYSLALLLVEQGLLGRSELTGIDCRTDAIRAARDGVFAPSLVAGVAPALLDRHFVPVAGGYRVGTSIRSHTRWQVMDATSELPPGPWDLVLCRNLFIYLQHGTIDAMLTRMIGQLTLRGFLVVGKAERPAASLGLKAVGRCIYTRHVR